MGGDNRGGGGKDAINGDSVNFVLFLNYFCGPNGHCFHRCV